MVQRSLDATVGDDLGAAGTRARDCGVADDFYEDWIADASPARDCFVQAFRTCTPARAAGIAQGMDGGPHLWEAAVVAGDGGCEIRLYKDTRNDQWSAPAIERYRCADDPKTCALVWSEDRSICRAKAGGDYWCTQVPRGLRWSELARHRDTDEDDARATLREAIDYDIADQRLAPVRRHCGSTRGPARDVLGGTATAADCFATAFATCEPAEIRGREEPGPTDWIAIVARDASGACAVRIYTDTRLDPAQLPVITGHTCARLAGADPDNPDACTLAWREDHRMCRKTATTPGECVRLPLDVSWAALEGPPPY